MKTDGPALSRFRQVDLNLLVVLRVLLEERSVTRAAARLRLGQPAVSGALARLRDLLGDEYFDADPEVNFADTDLLAFGPVLTDLGSSFDLYWNSEFTSPISGWKGLRAGPEAAAELRTELDAGVELHEIERSGDFHRRLHRRGLFGSSSASLHSQTFVFDRRYVFIGSLNVDPRSVDLNTEIGLVVDSVELGEERAASFERANSAWMAPA